MILEALHLCTPIPIPKLRLRSISVDGQARRPPRSGLDYSNHPKVHHLDLRVQFEVVVSLLKHEAWGMWSLGFATDLFLVPSTLSVLSGGHLYLFQTCSSSLRLMYFPSSRNDSPWQLLADWNRWSTIYLFPPPVLASFSALYPLMAITPLILERLVRRVHVYAPKVTSLRFHTFLIQSKP